MGINSFLGEAAELKKTIRMQMIDSEHNHNKVYIMKDNGDGHFTASWGRIGYDLQSQTYPMSKWYDKLDEKRKKGYEVITR